MEKNFAFDANERGHKDARMEETLQSGYMLNKLPKAPNRNDTPTSRDDFDSLCQVLVQHHRGTKKYGPMTFCR